MKGHFLHKHVVISSCANSLFQVTRNARELATGAMACDRPRAAFDYGKKLAANASNVAVSWAI